VLAVVAKRYNGVGKSTDDAGNDDTEKGAFMKLQRSDENHEGHQRV
jgi:hypothetical protein